MERGGKQAELHGAAYASEVRRVVAEEWGERLATAIERHRVPGATLGILYDGEITATGTGVLSKATGVETTADSLFQIGSITKVWTATLVVQLADEGLLGLDTPVAEQLPGFAVADPEVTRSVTPRHLLTHTSGIDGDIFNDTGRGDDCLERYVTELSTVEQIHPLGATWSYCNSGYGVLGRLVEHLTGTTWDRALRDRLIEPLGLTHTVTLPEEALLHRVAVGHVGEPDEEPVPTTTWGIPRSAGPAGLVTARVADVLAFVRLHLSGGVAPDGSRLLSEESTEAMTRDEARLPDRYTLGDSWGLGWMRFGWVGERLIGHDGATIGQSAFLRALPSRGLAVSLLTNGGRPRDLFEDVVREVFDELAGVTMQAPVAPADEVLEVVAERYVGRYERIGVTTEVFERESRLVLRSTLTGALAELAPSPVHEYDLHPVEPDVFAMRPPGASTWTAVTFYALDDGARYVHYGARANPLVSD